MTQLKIISKETFFYLFVFIGFPSCFAILILVLALQAFSEMGRNKETSAGQLKMYSYCRHSGKVFAALPSDRYLYTIESGTKTGNHACLVRYDFSKPKPCPDRVAALPAELGNWIRRSDSLSTHVLREWGSRVAATTEATVADGGEGVAQVAASTLTTASVDALSTQSPRGEFWHRTDAVQFAAELMLCQWLAAKGNTTTMSLKGTGDENLKLYADGTLWFTVSTYTHHYTKIKTLDRSPWRRIVRGEGAAYYAISASEIYLLKRP